ncbi:hypothetical protein [Gracilibacillus sp. YIM 98692]|uniref:hypothetical protein n=1 Tax=Gracilibacillus sp. YIM 98692 TaxID=2663532 RepID=UPI0013D6E464|nr:hypothetical protein [Gracilibacillus sp. YIM 98692]
MTKRVTINDMRLLALSKGGKCISTKYVNGNTELECIKGHRWFAKPSKVKRGNWCEKCASNTDKNIEDMHKLAEQYGGKCISAVYINNHSSL